VRRCALDDDQESSLLQPGDRAPDFTLPSSEGGTVSLDDLAGRPAVLYFYPKDDTAGCTAQACGLRDNWPAIQAAGAAVVGISGDDVASHERFRDRHALPFPLLADTDHTMARAYGTWVEKERAGQRAMGISRSTFIIDGQGRLTQIFRDVKPAEHVGLVLGALRGGA